MYEVGFYALSHSYQLNSKNLYFCKAKMRTGKGSVFPSDCHKITRAKNYSVAITEYSADRL